LVTGCSSGIGRATALALVRAGFATWASARRPETLADLAAAGCRVLRLDVTDEESRVRAVEAVEAEHGAVGVLVNSAGYAQVGPMEEISPDSLRRQFETNVFGLVRMCQLVLPAMRARHDGTIVNLGSAAGLVTPPASGAYSMTKYALEALCDAMRLELRGFDVQVVLVEPGAVRTGFMATSWSTLPHGDTPGPYDAFTRNVDAMAQRAHRPGARGVLSAQDVAGVVVKAVTARRPRTRYKIGSQVRVAPLVRRVVPDRLWDAMMLRVAPFPAE
jgi:NAD(P)-dependent dehydrogenase (short-subunit alcohol dehydrogenase family)